MQYIRLLLFYSVIFQSCKFQSPVHFYYYYYYNTLKYGPVAPVNFSNSLRELGPALYVLNAGDLTSIMSGNQLKAYKYADDTYIVVPAVNIYSCEAELEHIEKWAARNKPVSYTHLTLPTILRV